ncbi:RNA guanine-N7 methyltransferase activating subunit [Dissostichus eleginoides]|uniref:RNA guanine-N7 methyltransferase activating subunit n=1 Tax=Dissostichus eleginoides TaxID=100907 RepID=A0AAD9BWI1_DISEL|nr:RNA guanine-N7 methyltransferase activating subunit [Dissostichus eleginoides]
MYVVPCVGNSEKSWCICFGLAHLFVCIISMAETTETRQSNEEMFANRFTSDDREYQQYLSRPADLPPIVEDWRSRGGGNRRGSRDR